MKRLKALSGRVFVGVSSSSDKSSLYLPLALIAASDATAGYSFAMSMNVVVAVVRPFAIFGDESGVVCVDS